jgi:hypothetical protein
MNIEIELYRGRETRNESFHEEIRINKEKISAKLFDVIRILHIILLTFQ